MTSVVDAQGLPLGLVHSRSHAAHHVCLESDGFVPTVYPDINTAQTLGLPVVFKDFGEYIYRLKWTHTFSFVECKTEGQSKVKLSILWKFEGQ